MSFLTFEEYFDNKNKLVLSKYELIQQPTDFEILSQIRSEIANIKNIIYSLELKPFLTEKFIQYLKDNISYHSHFIVIENGKYKNDFSYSAPEVVKQLWNDFILTKLWLSQLQDDKIITLEEF